MHGLSDRQIPQLFTQTHQLVDHAFELAHGLNLLAIEWNQSRIGDPNRDGLAGCFTGQQRIRAPSDAGTIGVFNGQILLSEGATAQFTQVG